MALSAAVQLGACAPDAAVDDGPAAPASAPTVLSLADPLGGAPWRVPLALLHAEELGVLARVDLAQPPDVRALLGPEPLDLVAVPQGLLVVLAEPPALLWLDDDGARRGSLPLEGRPSSVAWTSDDTAWIGQRDRGTLLAVRLARGELRREPARDVQLPVASVTDLTAGANDVVYAVSEHADQLVSISRRGELSSLQVARAPIRVETSGELLAISSLVDHQVSIYSLDARGRPDPKSRRDIQRQAAATAMSLWAPGKEGLLALGALEDRPLDRSGGSFGNIDASVELHRISAGTVERLWTHPLGELGLVNVKALELRAQESGGFQLFVTSYGSEASASSRFAADAKLPSFAVCRGLPGTRALARSTNGDLWGANPLLDSVVRHSFADAACPTVTETTLRAPADGSADTARLRLGEALFYTTLMAPWQKSNGPLSRFTCESCHFEGGIDGRTHHTGRGDVRATTKPLFGLLGNAPHFTRANDQSTASMIHAEFRVAAANSGHDPFFDLTEAPSQWQRERFFGSDTGPAGLRRALFGYLSGLPHAPNPNASRADRRSLEAGADAFAKHCQSCHAPRIAARDGRSEVLRDQWLGHLEQGKSAILWARDGYEKTGIEPYVHPEGARPTSLRRAIVKRPYFTNGSAQSLDEVVAGFCYEDGRPMHRASRCEHLAEAEQRALVAFLRVL